MTQYRVSKENHPDAFPKLDVASAVGEGSMAVQFVHQYLATQ